MNDRAASSGVLKNSNKGILDFPENYHDLLQYVKIFVKRNLQNYFFYLVSVAKLTF